MAEGGGSSFSWDGGTSLPNHGGLSHFPVSLGSWGLVLWLVWGMSVAFVLEVVCGSINFEGWKFVCGQFFCVFGIFQLRQFPST